MYTLEKSKFENSNDACIIIIIDAYVCNLKIKLKLNELLCS